MKKSRQISDSRLLFLIITAVALFLMGVMIMTSDRVVQFRPLVALTCLVNIFLFAMQLLRAINVHSFGFDMLHWLFCLFFLGFAPLLRHMTDSHSWNLIPTNAEFIIANLLYTLWAAFYILGRDYRKIPCLRNAADSLGRKLQPLREKLTVRLPDWEGIGRRAAQKLSALADKIPAGKEGSKLEAYRKTPLKTKILDLLLLASVMAVVLDLAVVGVKAQITRNTSGGATGNTALDLIFVHGINNLLLFVAVAFILEAKKAQKVTWRTVTALACLGIAAFPTGLSRNMMASFYAGLLVLTFDVTKKGRWFSWVIFGGLVLIFPAMEIFRRISTLKKEGLWDLILSNFSVCYLEGHFDAHQMIITIMRYVKEFGFAWGGQILGALLFFVPRSIWPGKPAGTGHTAIVALDQFYFTNVSANLAVEGYMNFGLLGIALFAVLVGILSRRADLFYWRRRSRWEEKLGDMLYPFVMFMFFFLMRGDMMSAWAYTFAQLAVGSVIIGIYLFACRFCGENSSS